MPSPGTLLTSYVPGKKQYTSLSKYIYYSNTTCPPGCLHNGFMATDALGLTHVQFYPRAPVAIKPLL